MNFVKRPLAILTLTMFVTFCLIANFGLSIKWYVLLLFLPVPVILLVLAYRPLTDKKISLLFKYAFLFLMGIFLAFSLLSFGPNDKKEENLYAGTDGTCQVKIIYELWENKQGTCYKAKVLSVNESKENFYIALKTKTPYGSGDVVSGTVYFSKLINSETFDMERYCLSKGIILGGTLYDGVFEEHQRKSLSVVFSDFSKKLQEKIKTALPEDCAGLSCAVMLGDKSGISDETRRDFAKIGISHLIAVSGMHVSFISVAFYKLMRILGVNKKLTAFLCIFLMLFYMGIAGFSASVVRAAVLSCMLSLFIIAGFGYDGITALGVCGCIMITLCPYFAYDIGMQLSFSAYASCIAGSHVIKRVFGRERKAKLFLPKNKNVPLYIRRFCRWIDRLSVKLLSSVLFTVIVVLFTLPVCCIYYDSLSVISPFSNLIFIPLFSIIMYASIVVLLLSGVGSFGSIVCLAAEKFISFVLFLTSELSSLDNITVSLNYSFTPYVVAFMFFGTILLLCRNKKAFRIGAICIAFSVTVYAAGVFGGHLYMKDKHDVSLIHANSGSALVICNSDETVLCDASSGSSAEAVTALNRATALRKAGIDAVILTRYDEGHIDLISKLCSIDYPKKVYLCSPDGAEEQRIKRSIQAFLEEKNIETETVPSSLKELKTEGSVIGFVKKDGIVSAVHVKGVRADYLYLSDDWTENAGRIAGLSKETGTKKGYVVLGYDLKTVKELKKAEIYFDEKYIIAYSKNEEVFEWAESESSAFLYGPDVAVTVRID